MKAAEDLPTGKDTLASVVRTLEAEREAVEAQLAELDQQKQVLRRQVKRIAAAIAALKGKPEKPAAKGGGKAAYTTAEVAGMVGELLAEEESLSEKDLFARLKEAAGKAGRNRSGLHLRIKDALKDARFRQAADRWSLAEGGK